MLPSWISHPDLKLNKKLKEIKLKIQEEVEKFIVTEVTKKEILDKSVIIEEREGAQITDKKAKEAQRPVQSIKNQTINDNKIPDIKNYDDMSPFFEYANDLEDELRLKNINQSRWNQILKLKLSRKWRARLETREEINEKEYDFYDIIKMVTGWRDGKSSEKMFAHTQKGKDESAAEFYRRLRKLSRYIFPKNDQSKQVLIQFKYNINDRTMEKEFRKIKSCEIEDFLDAAYDVENDKQIDKFYDLEENNNKDNLHHNLNFMKFNKKHYRQNYPPEEKRKFSYKRKFRSSDNNFNNKRYGRPEKNSWRDMAKNYDEEENNEKRFNRPYEGNHQYGENYHYFNRGHFEGNNYRGNYYQRNKYPRNNYRRGNYSGKQYNNRIYQSEQEYNKPDTNNVGEKREKIEKMVNEMQSSLNELKFKNTEQIVLDDDYTNNLSLFKPDRYFEAKTDNGKPLVIKFLMDGNVILCKKKNNLLFSPVLVCDSGTDALIDSGASRSCIDISNLSDEEMMFIKPSNTSVFTLYIKTIVFGN
ncbi:hypothetical protein SNEBB_010569 [Seison nebaliae]|nr:hypothetical protein SNEBB_010569 [Seison nebaliae]